MTKLWEKLFGHFGANFTHFRDRRNFLEKLGSVNLLECTIIQHYAKN